MRHGKSIAAAVLASAVLFAAGAIAQQQGQAPAPNAPSTPPPAAAPIPREFGGWGGGMMGRGIGPSSGPRAPMSEADRTAFFEARIAAMKAGLMLTEAQQRLWPAVESAMRDMMKQRLEWAERIRKEGQPANPVDRMKRAGEMMSARGAVMTRMADAMKPLHDSLTDDQKRRMQMLRGGGMRGGTGEGMASQMRPHWRGSEHHRGNFHDGPGMRGEFQQRWQQHHGWQGRGGDYGRGNQGPGWRQGMGPREGQGMGQGDERGGWGQNDRGSEGRGWGRRWQQDAPGDNFGPRGDGGDWRRM